MTNLLKKLFLTFFSTSMYTFKEELGLARGLKTAESLWKRLAEDMYPVFSQQIKTDDDELSGTIQFLAGVFRDILQFEKIETKLNENSGSLRLNNCPFWNQIKENKLAPATHKLCFAFIETLARLKNPSLILDKIGCLSMQQGGDYCEFIWKKF